MVKIYRLLLIAVSTGISKCFIEHNIFFEIKVILFAINIRLNEIISIDKCKSKNWYLVSKELALVS